MISAFLLHGVIDEAGILVRKAVVVLAPDVGREQIIERRDGRAPGNFLARGLEPLGVLIEHRIDDVNESLVGGKQAVPAGEQIAFEPALAGMLAQDLHHPPIGRQVIVAGDCVGEPGAVGHFEQRAETIGAGFVGAENAEVARFQVELHHVAEQVFP